MVSKGYLISDDGKRYPLKLGLARGATLSSNHVEAIGRPRVISYSCDAPEGTYTLDCPENDAHGKRVQWKHGRVSMA